MGAVTTDAYAGYAPEGAARGKPRVEGVVDGAALDDGSEQIAVLHVPQRSFMGTRRTDVVLDHAHVTVLLAEQRAGVGFGVRGATTTTARGTNKLALRELTHTASLQIYLVCCAGEQCARSLSFLPFRSLD